MRGRHRHGADRGPLGHPGAPGGIRVERAFQRGDGTGPVWLGSAGRGDPIYDAGVQLGKLLRTAFLADYVVNAGFRRELRRVLNRGEAVNALKRAIYTSRVGPAQARRADEMLAVADALSLLANIVTA